jgi:predicted PurR-regulated permease PerM
LALAVDPGWTKFLATLGLFLVVELISNNFVEPWLYGASTGVSNVALIIAAVFWTWLWGPVGLFLSTPLTVCLVVLGKHVPALQFLSVLLGSAPALEPHERMYSACWPWMPTE